MTYSTADLEAHGFLVADLTPDQLDVLRNLTPAEFALLTEVKRRLEEAGPEVHAHSEIAGAALF